ncbi:unnamed protein product [Schistosoma rodhaini]|nr:unnamed protein product [Schistosoma rodhaini]
MRCCVCSLEFQNPSNSLIFCGNCNTIVHQGCYGVQKLTGVNNWFCRKCESQVRMSKIRCDLCPIKDGAFKRSNGVRCGWAHIVCAIYIPEVFFTDLSTMELISVENVMPDRLGRSCIFCERNQRSSLANYGACIQCAWKNCRLHFHVSCASVEGLLSELPATEANTSVSIAEILFKTTDKNKPSPNFPDDSTELSKEMNHNCEQQSYRYQLNGFCCSQHKKKFMSEGFNSSSVPAISHGSTDVNKVCKSPTAEMSCEVNNQPPRRRSSQLRLSQRPCTSDPNRADEGSNSQDDLKSDEKTTSECKSEFNHQSSSAIQEDQISSETRSPGSTTTGCPNVKRIKMDVNLSKDRIGEAIDTEGVLTSSSSSSSATTSNHSAVTSTITSSQSSVTDSTIPVTTQENLPLILPRRPLSLRGLGISCNSKNSSVLNNVAGMYVDSPLAPTNKVPISTKYDNSSPPTLATMHDLLEWQWDQAGALLMQQAKNTDVVTLLDCLHQLKCENDILEAKLIRLTTRHEHLKSVNARLSNSLATMESTMVINSPKHEISEQNSTAANNLTKKSNHHFAYPLDTNTTITSNITTTTQSSQMSTILHSIDPESHQLQLPDNVTKNSSNQPVTLLNNYSDPSSAKHSTDRNKKVPILPKDYTTTCSNSNLKHDSTDLMDNLGSFDKIHSTNCLNHTQPVFCTSLDYLKSPHESHLSYSNLIKHQPNTFLNDSFTPHRNNNNNQTKSTFDYLSSSCSSSSSTIPPTNSTYFTKSVDLNDLQELSARLSSAIAARQPQSTKSISSAMPSCPSLPKNSGQSKRNNKAVTSTQPSSSSKLPIPPLNSGSLVNCISKLETSTSCQNFCPTNSNNVQPTTASNNSTKSSYPSDQASLQSQSNPLSFMIFTSPTIPDIQNHSTPSSTNQPIVTTNEIISNELNTSESSVIVTTNSNSVSLPGDCKTTLTH